MELYFEEIDQKILNGNLTTGDYNELQSEQYRKIAFNMFKSRCNAISDNKYDTEIFYDSGYKRAFGIDGNSEIIEMALLIMIILVLTISPIISYDNSKKFTTVIFSTSSGKKTCIKNNIAISIVYSVFSSLVMSILYFINIINNYGTK